MDHSPEPKQLANLSNSDIVQRCLDPERHIVGGTPHGILVIRLSEDFVVKFGLGISVEEVDNQRRAFELLTCRQRRPCTKSISLLYLDRHQRPATKRVPGHGIYPWTHLRTSG